jgi:hypothetical protein
MKMIKSLFLLLCPLLFCSCASEKEDNNTKMPLFENTTGKTIIQRTSSDKEWYSDVNIISRSGTVIYSDAFKTPEDVTQKLVPDIICVTHMSHIEHVDQALIDANTGNEDCRISLEEDESFTYKDVNVEGIAISHGLSATESRNKNVAYVFEVDGLRIANMGGANLPEFSPDQLDRLGDIDIMFISLSMYGAMDIENVYKMCEILKPSIIIPTHSNNTRRLDILSPLIDSSETVENILIISKEDIKEGEIRLITLINTLYETEE